MSDPFNSTFIFWLGLICECIWTRFFDQIVILFINLVIVGIRIFSTLCNDNQVTFAALEITLLSRKCTHLFHGGNILTSGPWNWSYKNLRNDIISYLIFFLKISVLFYVCCWWFSVRNLINIVLFVLLVIGDWWLL